MKAIYRTRSVLKANLLRVPHAVMAAVAVIFLQLYRIRSLPGGSSGGRARGNPVEIRQKNELKCGICSKMS